MPIGKNAIKRISNNGYSNVKTEAPDMENSVVAEQKSDEVKAQAPKKSTAKTAPKTAPKAQANKTATKAQANKTATRAKPKASPKAAPKKSMEVEVELSPVNTAKKIVKSDTESAKRQGSCYINIGGELPIHLL